MPHLVAIETCTLGLVSKIPFVLASFERSPLLHKTSLWFGPQALKLFGFILGWATLPPVPFPLMPWLFVKELVVFLELGFVTPPHI
jgi:hypothetical protein